MSKPWPAVKLGEVLTRRQDVADVSPLVEYQEVTVKLWGKGVVERQRVMGSAMSGGRRFVVRAGQFILSRIDARNGALGIVPPELDGALVSNDFPVFDANSARLLPGFLGWMVRTPAFVELCKKASEGTTNRVRLKEERFLDLEIPLPSLGEQRRIVGRIEELAGKIAEAQRLREQATQEAEAMVGTRAQALFSPIEQRQPIAAIADVRGGIQKGPHREPGENPVRYLTVAHVQRDSISTDDPRYFEVTAAELERWRLLAGDVLIIEGNGSAEQIGRTALFRGEIADCVHQNHVIRIRPDQDLLLADFLNKFLNGPAGQSAVQEQARTTSGLRTLSVGRIKKIRVPVPSLAEQRRIVEYLDDLQGKVAGLKKLQAATQRELDALLPSLLDRAFKGEL